MTKKVLILAITLFLLQTVVGQNKKLFPNLSSIQINKIYKVSFNYDPQTTKLINIPCYLLDRKNPFFCHKDSDYEARTLVGKYKNKKMLDSLEICFIEGASADPEFEIYKKNGKKIGSITCLDFYITETGAIYTSGHTNSMFDKRRKFQILNDTILEVQQPFRYIGLKGRTLKPITLYQDKIGKGIVAQLPAKYEIEILLSESTGKDFDTEQNYLVKTEFGLIGWLRISDDDVSEPILKEFYYAGD